MRLYIQQLEERVRQLTGEVERLGFELRRAQVGLDAAPGVTGTDGLTGSIIEGAISGGAVLGGTVNPQNNASIIEGAPPQNLGSLSITVDDPRIAADSKRIGDGAGAAAPLDLSVLAGGAGIGLSGGTGLDQTHRPEPGPDRGPRNGHRRRPLHLHQFKYHSAGALVRVRGSSWILTGGQA